MTDEAGSAKPARRRLTAAAALLAYLALALVTLRPPLRELDARIASDRGDPVFVLYTMQWGAHQIGKGMPSFWHAPIFYPARWATTFSDHVLILAAGLALGGVLGVGPVAVYDLLFLLSFALSAWTCFLVFRRAGIGNAAAFLGGCLFGFSGYRFQQLPHLQVLWMVCLPPTLWTFDRLLAAPGRRTACAFVGFYALHVLGGNYLAYMIHLPLAVLFANRLADPATRARLRRRLPLLGGVAIACAACVTAVFLPYAIAARELGLRRTATDMLSWGGSLVSYLDPGGVWYSRFMPAALHRAENGLFAGFLASGLALWGVAAGVRLLRTPRPEALTPGPTRRLAVGATVALAILGVALGESLIWADPTRPWHVPRLLPALLIALAAAGGWVLRRWWRAPPLLEWQRLAAWDRGLLAAGAACGFASLGYVFVALAAILPGMSGMRVPTRFYPFVSLALAFVAARVLDRCRRRLSAQRATALIAVVAVLAAVDLWPLRTRWPWLPATPAIYARIASDPAIAAILELPFFQDASENNVYLQFQTAHWKPIVNGYSGFLPPGHADLRDHLLTPFPGPEGLAELRRLGVTHLVVHFDLMRRWQRPLFDAWIEESRLPVVDRDGPIVLLSTLPAEPLSHPNRS